MTFLIDGMAGMAYIWPLSSHSPQEEKIHDQEIIDTMLVEETEKRKVEGPVQGSRPNEGKREDEEEDEDDDEGEGSLDEAEDDDEAKAKPDVAAAIVALKKKKDERRVKKILKKTEQKKKKSQKKNNKGKLSAVKSVEEPAGPTLGLEECMDFEISISTKTVPPESRVKHALDDFLMSLVFARKNLATKISEAEYLRSKQFLVSLFLELAWTAQVTVNGKLFKTYSSFREECQRVFIAAHRRLQVGEEEFDPLLLAKSLMSMVEASVGGLSAWGGSEKVTACLELWSVCFGFRPMTR